MGVDESALDQVVPEVTTTPNTTQPSPDVQNQTTDQATTDTANPS